VTRLIRDVVLCTFFASLCLAQYGNQEISGFVLDPHEAVVPHAKVSARHPAFRTPAPGTFGNLGRGVLTGPGIVNWDVSMQKTFRLREHLSAHLRVECFNVLDHFSWGVEGSMASARFGQVTTTTDPRSVQTMLRLSF
jgi:hypothetical protein